MTIYELINKKKNKIKEIAIKHGVTELKLFGSVARHEATRYSDVDFLVKTGSKLSFFFPAGLIIDLEKLLKRKVDVITEKNLKSRIKNKVLKEAITL